MLCWRGSYYSVFLRECPPGLPQPASGVGRLGLVVEGAVLALEEDHVEQVDLQVREEPGLVAHRGCGKRRRGEAGGQRPRRAPGAAADSLAKFVPTMQW